MRMCSVHRPLTFQDPMPAVSCPALLTSHPRSHLVAAVVVGIGADERGTLLLRDLRDLLARFVARLRPAGRYALFLSRAHGFPEILCGFAERADAERLAAAVSATAGERFPEWASQHVFRLDETTAASLSASLLSDGDFDQGSRP